MIARHVTKKELNQALRAVNKQYNNNVEYNRAPEKQGTGLRFTLRVKDSQKPGHRLGFPDFDNGKQRRMVSACWHVHGEFFDRLMEIQPEAIIRTGAGNKHKIWCDGESGEVYGNWEDTNIGSTYRPLFFSEACECE